MAVPSLLQAGTQFFWILPNGSWQGPLRLTKDREVHLLEIHPDFVVYHLDGRYAVVRSGDEGTVGRRFRRKSPRTWTVRRERHGGYFLVHQNDHGQLQSVESANPENGDSMEMCRAFFATYGEWMDLLYEPDRTFVKMGWGVA